MWCKKGVKRNTSINYKSLKIPAASTLVKIIAAEAAASTSLPAETPSTAEIVSAKVAAGRVFAEATASAGISAKAAASTRLPAELIISFWLTLALSPAQLVARQAAGCRAKTARRPGIHPASLIWLFGIRPLVRRQRSSKGRTTLAERILPEHRPAHASSAPAGREKRQEEDKKQRNDTAEQRRTREKPAARARTRTRTLTHRSPHRLERGHRGVGVVPIVKARRKRTDRLVNPRAGERDVRAARDI